MKALELVFVGSADTSLKKNPVAKSEEQGDSLSEFKYLLPVIAKSKNKEWMLKIQQSMIEGF